jgi:hypothetical protein
MYVTCPAYLIHRVTWVLFGEYISWCSSLCSIHQSCFTSSSLGPLYLPQHPVPEHFLLVLFPKCKKLSLSPIQNKKTRSAFYKQQNCTFELLVVSPYLKCCVSLLYLGVISWLVWVGLQEHGLGAPLQSNPHHDLRMHEMNLHATRETGAEVTYLVLIWIWSMTFSQTHDILCLCRAIKYSELIFHSHSVFPFLAHSQPEGAEMCLQLTV